MPLEHCILILVVIIGITGGYAGIVIFDVASAKSSYQIDFSVTCIGI